MRHTNTSSHMQSDDYFRWPSAQWCPQAASEESGSGGIGGENEALLNAHCALHRVLQQSLCIEWDGRGKGYFQQMLIIADKKGGEVLSGTPHI